MLVTVLGIRDAGQADAGLEHYFRAGDAVPIVTLDRLAQDLNA